LPGVAEKKLKKGSFRMDGRWDLPQDLPNAKPTTELVPLGNVGVRFQMNHFNGFHITVRGIYYLSSKPLKNVFKWKVWSTYHRSPES